MQEKYLAFENLQPGEERKFKLLYKVGQIDQFKSKLRSNEITSK